MASTREILRSLGQGNILGGAQVIADLRGPEETLGRNFTAEEILLQTKGLMPDPDYTKDTPGFFESILTSFAPTVLNAFAPGAGTGVQQITATTRDRARPRTERERIMGFFDDIFGSDDTSSTFNQGLTATPFDWGGLLNTGVQAIGSFLGPSQNVPMPMQGNLAVVPRTVMSAGVPMIRGAAAALSARLASIGLNRSTALTLLKQQGPTALLALGLTALEVTHLANSAKRRRMNMCNGRALRRASRRLEGFHRFYKRTCGLPIPRRRSRSCK